MRKLLRDNSFPLTLGCICLLFSCYLYVEEIPSRSVETLPTPAPSTPTLVGEGGQAIRGVGGEAALETTPARSPTEIKNGPAAHVARTNPARTRSPRQAVPPETVEEARGRAGQQDSTGSELAPVGWRDTRERP